MSDDRTEKPTGRRLSDARKKGQLARSRDVEGVAQLVAILLVLGWTGRAYVFRLANAVRAGLERVGDTPLRTLESTEIDGLAIDGALVLAATVGPIAAAAAFATIASATVQGGWNFTTEPLRPNLGRLNPATGIRRLGFQRAGFDLLKMVVAVTALGWVATRAVMAVLDTSIGFARVVPEAAAALGWVEAERLLKRAAVVLAIVAAGDYALQRWRLMKSLRMTKQEVKDESKMIEGNPEIKGRIRSLQRDLFRRRMMAAVPTATVVVTNPTHYAVALLYERGQMAAPQVVAKGRNLVAARIREIAREHGVPIVENVPLAQALYRGTDVGDSIPADLFGAVAEVLAYLIRLKQLVL